MLRLLFNIHESALLLLLIKSIPNQRVLLYNYSIYFKKESFNDDSSKFGAQSVDKLKIVQNQPSACSSASLVTASGGGEEGGFAPFAPLGLSPQTPFKRTFATS